MSRKLLAMGLILVASAGALALLASRTSAQTNSLLGPERQALVYNGDVRSDAGGIKLTSWGSGQAEAISDGYHYFEGPEVLKVKTQGPYQGVVLRLTRSVELTSFLADRNAFLELRVMPAQNKRVKAAVQPRPGRGGGGRAGGAGGSPGGGIGGRRGGGGGPGGGAMAPSGTRLATGSPRYELQLTQMGGGEAPGSFMPFRRGGAGVAGSGVPGGAVPGRPGAPAAAQEVGFSARNLRLVLYTDKGVMVANEVPLEQGVKDDRGWYRLAWPLGRFSSLSGATEVQAVGLFSDEAETFYLGQVRLIVDRQTVKAVLKATPTITTVGKVIDFAVELTGGQIDPEVSWDFNSADGIQRQAVGLKTKYLYKKPGDYVVTATITDRSGLQAPIKKTVGLRLDRAPGSAATSSSSTSPAGTTTANPKKDRKNPTALDAVIEVK